MKRNVEDFSKCFIKMSCDSLKELENKDVDPKKVITLLKLPSVYREFLDTLYAAADIRDLFDILSTCWDYFNYHLLERLIMALGTDSEICCQLQRDMKQYIMEMDVFRRQTPLNKLHVHVLHFGKRENVPKGLGELTTVCNWSQMQTLQDVENLRQGMAKMFQGHKCLLFFKQIIFGSVKLVWWIPLETFPQQLQHSCKEEVHVNAEVVNWVSQ